MGNFSRDPKARLADSVAKHYVGVRLQQGVPIVDADWNELEDLRRYEFENMGARFIGNGVPTGSDGFLIFSVSQTNDFGIRQGVCLIKGKLAENDNDVHYTTQPNFGNHNLDEPLPPLTTSTVDKQYIVYLDVWEREVDSEDDAVLVDSRIGVETAIRLRREWAVRVARVPEDLPKLEAPPPGHVFYGLARLSRQANNANITSNMIDDLRDTQVSVQRKIEVRNAIDLVVVDSRRFRQMLENARNKIFAFMRYITTQFNARTSLLRAVEVLGLQAAEHIARTAETGLGLVNSESITNRGALSFLFQLYHSENNFMTVWRDEIMQLFVGAAPKYASYQSFIQRLDQRLNQPTVGVLVGLLPALQAGNVEEAVKMQEEINRLIGAASGDIPLGSIQIFLAQSPLGNLISGQIARFQFRARSFTTLADTYTVTILPAAGWPRMVVDSSGNPIPGNKVSIGASGSQTTIFVDVTVQTGSSGLQLRVTSDANPAEIDQLTGLYTLTVGQPAPVGEDQVQLHLTDNFIDAALDPVTGVVSIQRTHAGVIEVRVFNQTGQQATFNLTLLKQNEVGVWTAQISGTPTLIINNGNSLPKQVIVTPGTDAVSMQLRITATATIAGTTVSGQIVISFMATAT